MAFDFPDAPTTGQIYQPTGGPAWQYDGEKWKGGAIAGPQKEQFIDCAGRSAVDLTVPTWAKACRITGNIFLTVNSNLAIRVSADGTTFFAGATDYSWSGPYHTIGSPPAYQHVVGASGSSLLITVAGSSFPNPQMFTVDMNLIRPSTSHAFALRGYAKTTDAAAATLTQTFWSYSYVSPALTTALALKALRFFPSSGGTFAAASTLHVEWLGDDAQIPTQNAIPDAPSDNGEYVRVNGVWRLRAQTFDLAGLNFKTLLPPAWGPKRCRVSLDAYPPAAVNTILARMSGDGTTFAVGATDYSYSGVVHYGGSNGSAIVAHVNSSSFVLCWTQDYALVQHQVDATFALWRATTGATFGYMSRSMGFMTSPTQYIHNDLFTGYTALGGSNPSLVCKGIQILTSNSGIWGSGNLNVEWLA